LALMRKRTPPDFRAVPDTEPTSFQIGVTSWLT
jgi:hypothetical protein